jgi:poly-gamma-glutamate synthesis protein (capsule biosynthesis protein)
MEFRVRYVCHVPGLALALALCVAAGPAAADPSAEPVSRPASNTLTITLGGDLGLGGSGQPVEAGGALRHGASTPWASLTAGIKPLLTGDLNFANLETVVTDRNALGPVDKAFNFRSHPAGVGHLVDIGFNVFSTANNHAIDYGGPGLADTVRHLSALGARGLKAWPGVGFGRQAAARASDITLKGTRVRISAIGIGGGRFDTKVEGRTEPATMLSYHSPTDFAETLDGLVEAEGDYRILSVHYGAELQVRPSQADQERLRDMAVIQGGIDLVVGHHAHVALGVQTVGGKLIFYGLGNLLHPGMQNMEGQGLCRDYGLFARVHLAIDPVGKPRARAIEVIPLTDMHAKAKPLAADEAKVRIAVLNHLARDLDHDESGAAGVRFTALPDGRGLHCLPGAGDEAGAVGALCRDWQPPATDAQLARRVAASCGTGGTSERVAAARTSTVVAEQSGIRRRALSKRRGLQGDRETTSVWDIAGRHGN